MAGESKLFDKCFANIYVENGHKSAYPNNISIGTCVYLLLALYVITINKNCVFLRFTFG